MAVDFAADMQQELDYFAAAPPTGMAVDGIFSDCPRTTREWINSQCASGSLPGDLCPTQSLQEKSRSRLCKCSLPASHDCMLGPCKVLYFRTAVGTSALLELT